MNSAGLLAVHNSKTSRERLGDAFAVQCRAHNLPQFHRNHRFALSIGREWRFDFAWPELEVGIEIETLILRRLGGVTLTTGRQTTPEGFREEFQKHAAAALLGWTALRFEQSMITSGEAVAIAQRLIQSRAAAAYERGGQ